MSMKFLLLASTAAAIQGLCHSFRRGTYDAHAGKFIDSRLSYGWNVRKERFVTSLTKAKREGEVEELLENLSINQESLKSNISLSFGPNTGSDKVVFPELEQAGIDEKALRKSPFGKVLFGILGKRSCF